MATLGEIILPAVHGAAADSGRPGLHRATQEKYGKYGLRFTAEVQPDAAAYMDTWALVPPVFLRCAPELARGCLENVPCHLALVFLMQRWVLRPLCVAARGGG